MSQPDAVPDHVRVHWPIVGGRFACLTPREPLELTDEQHRATPFCGACLLVLMLFRLHSEELWADCRAPVDRPSAALRELAGTRWAGIVDADAIDGGDLWWFERGDDDLAWLKDLEGKR